MKQRILSMFLALCMALALLPAVTPEAEAADSGVYGDNITWALDKDGTLTIRGTGAMWDNLSVEVPWSTQKASIKKVVIEKGVTAIGGGAFYDCRSLTSITIPDSVVYIRGSAFSDCRSLTSITIPNSVTSVGDWAFHNCYSLTSVTIPSSVTSIGGYAFYCCTSLASITIPDSVKSIEDAAFLGCHGLTGITIPSSVTSIGWKAFFNCSSLKNVYYTGTETQWDSIKIDNSDKKNAPLLSATLYLGSVAPGTPIAVTLSAYSGKTYTRTVKAGEKYGALPEPTRSGYTFAGWYTAPSGGTEVTSATPVTATGAHTLYGRWTKIQNLTVTFNANGGTTPTKTKTVTKGGTYGSLPELTRTGYTFAGWYTKPSGGMKVTSATTVTATGAQTLYAHWTKLQTLTVTFNANGGTTPTKTKTVTKGKTYSALPTPTRQNYHFLGWYTTKASTGGTQVTTTKKVTLTGKQTLYARWSKDPVTVKTTKSGSWKVTPPKGWNVRLYNTSTTAAYKASYLGDGTSSLTCTRKVTLSNGTTRYYTKVNGKSYWFTYTSEMKVK